MQGQRAVDGIKDDRGTKGPGSQTATITLRSVKSRPIYEMSRRAGLFAAHKWPSLCYSIIIMLEDKLSAVANDKADQHTARCPHLLR